ncbi:MAG: hypothetical protein NUW21_01385 [Elusimicrobia bacterium]|nr:hypothetical protein [Elusimicrobiota bacterium]
MKAKKPALYLASAVAAAAVAAGGYYALRPRVQVPDRIEAHLNTWYDSPRREAERLIELYGPPDDVAPALATWREREPFKRIAVHGDSPDTYLEHVIGYRAPPEALEALSRFGHGVRFNPENEELSARSNLDSLNYLALNLADEVVKGERTPEDADAFYVRTARFATFGKSAAYMERLRFEPLP